jgi:DNA-binding GntR family transcriptional regulator
VINIERAQRRIFTPNRRSKESVKRPNAERLRDSLEDAIINGRLLPGERLDSEALSKQFGVSRTPIREAIQQLSASGMVVVLPKKGTFVAKVSFDQLIEMFEVMAEFEGMCGRLAARRITEDELTELKAALLRCEDPAIRGNPDDYYYENEHFHHCIYNASHNAFLATKARQLKQRLKPYRRLQLQVRGRVTKSIQEHRDIYLAINAGDGELAEKKLRQHVLIQGEHFGDFAARVRAFSESSQKSFQSEP